MRKARKLTLKQAAALVGYSFSFLSDVERGKAQPSFTTLQKLSTAYGETITVSLEPEKVKK